MTLAGRIPRLGGKRAPAVDVLTVCTGNICRSPYIAGAMAVAVPGLTVAGAGVGAMTGLLPVPEVITALELIDAPTPSHARQIRRDMIQGARLIVTATSAHTAEVVRLDPTAEERTFTIKELSRLVGSAAVADEGWSLLDRIEAVRAAASAARLADPWDHDDDLADPYGKHAEAYATMIAEVDEAIAVIAPALAGRGSWQESE